MPAGRIYMYKKKRFYKPTSKSRYRQRNQTTAQKALKLVQLTTKGIERKFVQQLLVDEQIDWDGNMFIINETTPGADDDSERVGDKITMTSVEINLKFEPNDQTIAHAQVRYILLIDKENTILPADVFIPLGNDARQPYKMFTIDNRHKFIVLDDRIIKVGPDNSLNTNRDYVLRSKFNLKNRDVQFLAQSDQITKNALKIFVWSFFDPAQADNVKPQFWGYVRVRYTDS